jgi:hypothetical protein
LLLLIPQLVTNSGKRFSQIGFHTFRVVERRIKDGRHLPSTALRVTGMAPQESFEVSLRSYPLMNSAIDI